MSIEKNLLQFFQLFPSSKINELFKPMQEAARVGAITDAKVYVALSWPLVASELTAGKCGTKAEVKEELNNSVHF